MVKGHLMADYVHMAIAISPECAASSVIGFLRGKSAIAVARLQGKEGNFTGEHLWARSYAGSTIGFESAEVRRCVREQDDADAAGQF
jgi:putative transposase